ncbi:MAG: nuclear transport factor 2 family protein [Armatimonadetes bacterium]|nr:nuclear transport factor 2 family protein [Armatimonadota bacterium]
MPLLPLCLLAIMQQPTALEELIAAERAFSALSKEKGMKASFMANFADDAVSFGPDPRKAKESFAELPSPAEATMTWEPKVSIVAASGDFGFNSGPFSYLPAGAKEPVTGVFSSVWQKKDGVWKVVFDGGCGRTAFTASLEKVAAETSKPATQEELEKLDSLLPDLGKGWQDIRQLVAAKNAVFINHPSVTLGNATKITSMGGGCSSDGSLAYTYGTLDFANSNLPHTAYVHLWIREQGAWKLAFELFNQRPKPSSK